MRSLQNAHFWESFKAVSIASVTAHQHLPPKIGKVTTQCQKTQEPNQENTTTRE